MNMNRMTKLAALCAALALLFTAGFTACDTNSSSPSSSSSGSSATSAAVKAAPEKVGDVVMNDGTAIDSANVGDMSDEQKENAIAVIFYVSEDEDAELGARMLGVGKISTFKENQTRLQWASASAQGFSRNITAIQCSVTEGASSLSFSGVTNGKENYAKLKAWLAANATDDTGTASNYPAFEWADAYGTRNGLTGAYATGWYLPSIAEVYMLMQQRAAINSILNSIKGHLPYLYSCWSSSQSDGYKVTGSEVTESCALVVNVSGRGVNSETKTNARHCSAIREF